MAKARGTSPVRWARSVGGRLVRRVGLLPADASDRLGDDETLSGTVLPQEVMVFYPDPPRSLHELERWYPALRELDRRRRVVVVLQDSRTARAVRRDSSLDSITVSGYTTMDDLLSRSDMKVALYVSDHEENFSNLRFGSMVHARLLCGNGGQAMATSHLINAYDFALVPGRAAVDWIAATSTCYDALGRCIPVGLPLSTIRRLGQPGVRDGATLRGMTAVCVLTPGPFERRREVEAALEQQVFTIVARLIANGWTIIYRPNWSTDGAAVVDDAIRSLLDQSNLRGGRHRVDMSTEVESTFNEADLMLCDDPNSAVDWLPVDRPLLYLPIPGQTAAAQARLRSLMPCLDASDDEAVGRITQGHLETDWQRRQRRQLTEYCLQDASPSGVMRNFLDAVDRLIDVRDREHSRLTGLRASRG